jgi:type IV fimbrial biogenesis protein FimT
VKRTANRVSQRRCATFSSVLPAGSRQPRILGFTLIEMMVALSVLSIVAAIALPAFGDAISRAALRGAADAVMTVITDAKQESIKRDSFVNVRIIGAGNGFCVGAQPVAAATTSGCACGSGACAIAEYPAASAELKGVTLDAASNFGGGTQFAFDPRTGILANPATAGFLELVGGNGYRVRVAVNAMGRARLCSSPSGKSLAGLGAC